MKPATIRTIIFAFLAALATTASLAGSAGAQHGTPGTTQLVSRPTGAASPSPGMVNSSTVNGANHVASADGRFVVFESEADGLSSEDDNSTENVFVRDVQTGVTTLVSRATGPSGAPAHGDSFDGVISADGTRVAFSTMAALDPADTNGVRDVYVRDLQSNATILVSRGGASGAVGNKSSLWPAIDADGKRVVFTSNATNFSGDDTNNASDVYLRDLTTNTTSLISRATGIGTTVGDGSSSLPSISDSGKRVAFVSYAKNFDGADTNGNEDVYLRDLGPVIPTTQLVSKSTGGLASAYGSANDPSISGDGTTVAFEMTGKFDPADTNGTWDIYARDLGNGITTLVSRADGAAGAVGNSNSMSPSVNADGTKIAFQSNATNLSAADTNNDGDVYVRDLTGGTTKLLSRADTASGAVGNDGSTSPSISGDGSKIAFPTRAANFAGSPGPDFSQVYLRNTTANTTVLVSRPSGATAYVDDASYSSFGEEAVQNRVSADGRFVVFESDDDSLSNADDNRYSNVFVRDTLSDTTSLLSVAPNGANGNSADATISADGTTVAFESDASNIVAGDTNKTGDVFVRNLATGSTKRIDAGKDGASYPTLSGDGTKVAFATRTSLVPADTNNGLHDVYVDDLSAGTVTLVSRAGGPTGLVGNGDSNYPSMSAAGTKVAFSSLATNFAGVTSEQLYVRDIAAGTTTLVSRGNGVGPAGDSYPSYPLISADGTAVTFIDNATNLVAGDSNGRPDVFVRNIVADTTTLASRGNGAAGPLANDTSHSASISGDGTKVAFDSDADNLVSGDANKTGDVFVRDLRTNSTTLVSRAATGGPADDDSGNPSISANGDCVVFESDADNLTPAAPRSDFDRIFMATLSRECPVDPPETAITSAPPALTKSNTPSFGFSSNDPAASFQCSLDGGAFAACAATYATPPVADGKHTLAVRAVDPAGYLDASPAAASWTTDATPPALKVSVPKQHLRAVRVKGLRLLVSCNEACTLSSQLYRGKRLIGSVTAKLSAAGTKSLRIKLTRKAKRSLAHTRSVRLQLRTSAADPLGNQSPTSSRSLRLRR